MDFMKFFWRQNPGAILAIFGAFENKIKSCGTKPQSLGFESQCEHFMVKFKYLNVRFWLIPTSTTKLCCTSMSKPHLQYKLNLTMCTTPQHCSWFAKPRFSPTFHCKTPTIVTSTKKRREEAHFSIFCWITYDQAQVFLSPPARPKALKALTLTTH